MGRKTEFTQEIADEICRRIADGESLRSICADDSLPVTSTVCKWLTQQPAFAEQYARAREAQADALADEILDIADRSSNDWMERNDPDNPGYVLNGEAVRRSQLRIDARKWLAGKMKPKVYGDKVETTVKNAEGESFNVANTHQLGERVAFALRKGLENDA